jgi:hypothetical protein
VAGGPHLQRESITLERSIHFQSSTPHVCLLLAKIGSRSKENRSLTVQRVVIVAIHFSQELKTREMERLRADLLLIAIPCSSDFRSLQITTIGATRYRWDCPSISRRMPKVQLGSSPRNKPSNHMAFPHPQSRKDHDRHKETTSLESVTWKFVERTINVAQYWNAEDEMNAADNRTLRRIFHD